MWGTFTSSNSALLLIDHQVGTMKLIKNIPLEVAKRNTLALAKVAKILKMPVVLTAGTEDKFQAREDAVNEGNRIAREKCWAREGDR